MSPRTAPPSVPDARLSEVAERGQPLEVILVLRGKIRRAGDGRRWRMRVQGGRMITFAGDWVVAATPIGRSPAGPLEPGPGPVRQGRLLRPRRP